MLTKYSEDQPRDEAGRWTAVGVKLSAHQADIVNHVAAHGGKLQRLAGGFWHAPETPMREGSRGLRTPAKFTEIRTVRALERMGVLSRANEHSEEWKDTRNLNQPTFEGKASGRKWVATTPEDFVAARDQNKRAGFFSPLTPGDLRQHHVFMSEDGKVGFTLSPSGDIGNVFNNGDSKGAGVDAVADAVAMGGKTLDCYDGFLPGLYSKLGFKETSRVKFDPQYAPPKWDYEKNGQPDVVFMKHDGKKITPEQIAAAKEKGVKPAPPRKPQKPQGYTVKIGWTDAARAASLAARQHGYSESTAGGPGVARAYEHPEGHILDITGEGNWSHQTAAGDTERGTPEQLPAHLARVHAPGAAASQRGRHDIYSAKDGFGTGDISGPAGGGMLAPAQGVFRKPRVRKEFDANVSIGVPLTMIPQTPTGGRKKNPHAHNADSNEGTNYTFHTKELWSGQGNNPSDGDSFGVGPGVVGGHTFIVGRLKDGVIQLDRDFKRVNPYESIFQKKGAKLGKPDDRFRAEESNDWNPDSHKPRKYPDVGEDMGFNDSYLSKYYRVRGGTPGGVLHPGHWHHPDLDPKVEKYSDDEARDQRGRWTTGGGASPNTDAQALAQDYVKAQGREYVPPKVEPIDEEKSRKIAAAYEAMKNEPENPEVKAAHAAFAKETMAQYQALKKTGIKIEAAPEGQPDPYTNAGDVARDVRENNHMFYYPTSSGFGSDTSFNPQGNPMLADSGEKDMNGRPMLINDVFRVTHDYFGHVAGGHSFRPDGEDNAYRSHAAMYSPEATKAMAVGTRGQASWVYYGPHGEANLAAKDPKDVHFADQKTGLLPDWVLKTALIDFLAKWVRKYDPDEERDDHGRWTDGGGSAADTEDPDLVRDFPEPGDPPLGAEAYKVRLRDANEELLMTPDGQTYSGGSHVQMAHALGENLSDVIENKGWVRGRIDGTSIALELNLKNQTALKNALAILRAHGKDIENVFVDPPLNGGKGNSWLSGRSAVGEAARWLEAKVKKPGVKKVAAEPERYQVTKSEAAETDGKVRLGKCYQQAAYYIAFGPVRKGAVLVHGTIEPIPALPIPISHGWVEFRSENGAEVVYDGTQGQFYKKADYYRVMRAVPEQTYDVNAARDAMLKAGTFGPWGETMGMVAGRPR